MAVERVTEFNGQKLSCAIPHNILLNNCAHCGSGIDNGDPIPFQTGRGHMKEWVARCGNPECGSEVRGVSPEQCAARWNRRAQTFHPLGIGQTQSFNTKTGVWREWQYADAGSWAALHDPTPRDYYGGKTMLEFHAAMQNVQEFYVLVDVPHNPACNDTEANYLSPEQIREVQKEKRGE